jgi:putative transposase
VHCIADVLRDLKKESSRWAKENFDRSFRWQEGYAAFTVSPTATDSVERYIARQQAHHRKHSFVDELRELLNAAGIKFDEKYLL